MTKGKSTCKTLKAIRKQIALANNIDYEPRECGYEGPCQGTCPACEAEVYYLEKQLRLHQRLGRAVSLLGVSAGFLSACGQPLGNMQVPSPRVSGDVVNVDTVPNSDHVVMGEIVPEVWKKDTIKVARADSKIFGDCVEQLPMFRGGQTKLLEYLSENVRYPDSLAETCVQGRVVVSFVVEKDGSISEPKIVRSVDPALDAEALRVVGNMPKWIPGKMNGFATRVKYTIPVIFKLK